LFENFDLLKPKPHPNPQEIPIPSVGGVSWIFSGTFGSVNGSVEFVSVPKSVLTVVHFHL